MCIDICVVCVFNYLKPSVAHASLHSLPNMYILTLVYVRHRNNATFFVPRFLIILEVPSSSLQKDKTDKLFFRCESSRAFFSFTINQKQNNHTFLSLEII